MNLWKTFLILTFMMFICFINTSDGGATRNIYMDKIGNNTSRQLWSIPTADDTAGKAWVTDGAGGLVWSSVAVANPTPAPTATPQAVPTALPTATPQPAPTIGTFDSLSNVTITAVQVADVPSWNGSAWVNTVLPTPLPTATPIPAPTAQWSVSGSDIYRSSNVGIGTTAPGSSLDVKGTARLSGGTSGYVGISPAAAAGSVTYMLPSADGTSGQVLNTNGSGTLSWASSAGTSYNLTNYIKNGTVDFNDSDITDASSVASRSTTTPLIGAGDLLIDASATSQNVDFTTNNLDAVLDGRNCEASFSYKGDASLYTANIIYNATVVATQTLGNWAYGQTATINFPCGDLHTATVYYPFLRISSTADAAAIYVDNVYLGRARNIGSAPIGGQFFGSIKYAGTASCLWTNNTAGAWTSFAAVAACPTPTVTGNIIAPATKIPAVRASSWPQGKYVFVITGTVSSQNSGGYVPSASLKISDGTNDSSVGQFNSSNPANGNMAITISSITTTLSLSSSLGATTFDLRFYAPSTSGTETTLIDATSSGIKDFQIDVYYYPNQTATTIANGVGQPQFYSNTHGTDCQWDNTTASYDYVTDATCTFGASPTSINFPPVSECVAGQSCIKFTPTQMGVATFCVTTTFGSNTGANGSLALFDGANQISANELDATVLNSTNMLCAIVNITSLSEKNFGIKAKNPTSHTYYGSPGAVASTTQYTVSIMPNQIMPALTGSVATNGAAVERIERAYITNAGTPAISTQSGTWMTTPTDTGTGDVTLNIISGIFSAAPTCIATALNSAGTIATNKVATTTTTAEITTFTYLNAPADTPFYVQCLGPRGSL